MSPDNESRGPFTVLVTLKVPEQHQEDILRLAQGNLPIFQEQPGFLSARVFYSHDGTRILTLLEWESRAAHEACMQSPDWSRCDPQFTVLLDRGTMQMDVRTYVNATAEVESV